MLLDKPLGRILSGLVQNCYFFNRCVTFSLDDVSISDAISAIILQFYTEPYINLYYLDNKIFFLNLYY